MSTSKVISLIFISNLFAVILMSQTTIIDFETAGSGYTPSTTGGTGYEDVFNRINDDLPNATNEDGYYWAMEDFAGSPSIVLDQIDVSGSTSFTFSIDLLAHHYLDWDTSDEVLITYSVDGGAYQNLMWLQSINDGDAFNSLAALDTDFDGDGECASHLPSLTTGTNAGCTVSSSDFATFTSSSITLSSNSTLDITLQFNGLDGADEGIYLDNITITEVGGTPTPTLSINPATLTGFSYIFNGGPSSSQSFDLSGADLDGSQVTVTAPTNYEVSTDNTTFGTSVSVSYTAPTLSATTIYVRLVTGLAVGTYNGELVTCSDNGTASDITVSNDGEVFQPTLAVTTSTLTGYSYVVGSGPSISQSFDLSGTNMNGTQVTVTAPTNYEVSLDNTSFVASVNVSYTAPTLSATTIYVRLKAGLAINTYNGEIVTCNDNGDAADVTVSNDGEVTAVPVSGCATDLIISEYVEGSSNNKYIELYNGTGASVDLTDYQLMLFSNGSGIASIINTLSGTLADDATVVYSNASATIYGGTTTDQTSVAFNGDDAFALYKISTGSYVDIIGCIGEDPGSEWASGSHSTLNQTLVRKSSVTDGITTNPGSGFPTLTTEWDVYSEDEASYLGAHTMACSCTAPTTQAQSLTFPSIYSTQLTVNWTNGDGSKRIVIMNTANSFTDPTDGVDPAANSVYGGSGEQVVYNGTGNAVTVSGLTANTTYWFRVYEANCSGASIMYYTSTATNNPNSCITNSTAPPAGPTTFEPGDMIIVGFDTNIGNGGWDMITVASFVDIGPGTTFILANMVYEYEDAANVSTGRWYRCSSDAGKSDSGHPQYLEITYNGTAALSAGTVLCLTLNSNTDCLEEIKVNGVVSTDFSDNSSGQVNMSSSDPDAIFLMQGTFSGILTAGSSYNYRTFTGSVLGGIQSRGNFQPITVPGNNGGERVSRIHPDLECLKLNTGVATGEFYMYYYDWELHIGSQHALLNNIFDMAGTWDSGTGTTTTNEVPTCGVTFTITNSVTHGSWTGESNEDWFNCANWDGFAVPDSMTDVTIHSDNPYRNCEIDISTYSTTAARYGNVAQCNNLTLEGPATDNKKLVIQASPNNKLEVFGNLTITGNGMLDMTDGNSSTADGTLEIDGNWDNQVGPSSFDEGNSSVLFVGTLQQTISCNALEEAYYDVEVDNSDGLLLNDNIEIQGELALTNGIVTTATNRVVISNNSSAAITGYNTDAYINGNLRRYLASNTDTYPFPVGVSSRYTLAEIINNNMVTTSFLDALFTETYTSTGSLDPAKAIDDGTPYVSTAPEGIWQIDPDAQPTGGDYDIKLWFDDGGGGNPFTGLTDAKFGPLKRSSASTSAFDWDATCGTLNPNDGTGNPLPGRLVASGYSQRNDITSFSQFAIGISNFVLPVELLSFSAELENEKVNLEWKTASEHNNDYFTIERSVDGVYFYEILEVEGAGTASTDNTYTAIDHTPLEGISYYRLKQTDFDGEVSLSNPVSVSRDNDIISTFWYDQTSSNVYLMMGNDRTLSSVVIKISDMQGRIVYLESLNTASEKAVVYIDKNKLEKGIYILTIISENSAESKRIFID